MKKRGKKDNRLNVFGLAVQTPTSHVQMHGFGSLLGSCPSRLQEKAVMAPLPSMHIRDLHRIPHIWLSPNFHAVPSPMGEFKD